MKAARSKNRVATFAQLQIRNGAFKIQLRHPQKSRPKILMHHCTSLQAKHTTVFARSVIER
jgi:hypothetical protein